MDTLAQIRARYPAAHWDAGERPDTQPITQAQLAAAHARANARRVATATPEDRATRALLAVATSIPLSVVSVGLGAAVGHTHGAVVGLAVAAALSALRAIGALCDDAPL